MQRISITEIYAIRWIEIYPMDSAIQRLNNQGLDDNFHQLLLSGGGQGGGGGARENRGREGYGRREKKGREAGSLR